MCMYMYVCVHICIYVCISGCIFVILHVYYCVCVYVWQCAGCRCGPVCACTYFYIYVCLDVYKKICKMCLVLSLHVRSIYVCLCWSLSVCVSVLWKLVLISQQRLGEIFRQVCLSNKIRIFYMIYCLPIHNFSRSETILSTVLLFFSSSSSSSISEGMVIGEGKEVLQNFRLFINWDIISLLLFLLLNFKL